MWIDKLWHAGLSVFVKIRRSANRLRGFGSTAAGGRHNFGGVGSVSIGAWGWAGPRSKESSRRLRGSGPEAFGMYVALRGPRCRGNLAISHWKVSNA
jgi:hypothetical protein